MPPQAAAVSQQGDCCRHGQPPRWHARAGGEPLPFYLPQRKRLSVDGNAKPPGPRICIWECDGEAGDITCDIVAAPSRRSCSARPTQAPAPYSVGKSSALPFKKLLASDFDPREKVWTRFPPEGSKLTPPHHSVDFRWKDYCPAVFRHLRKLFGVDPADYMLAICGNDTLRELASPGKSGSCFFVTQDDRFMIKTVKKAEVKVLIRMLPSYYEHVRQHKSTLLTRFYGTHCIKQVGCPKVRFIIMGNFCCSEYKIHRRFDLKGSSHGRTTDKTERKIDETTTLKDLDLDYAFRLQRFWYEELMKKPFVQLGMNMPAQAERSSRKILDKFLLNERHLFISTPGGGPCDVYLFFGIIDILQDYDITKKLEHAYKSFQVNPGRISAVDPKLYSRRFQDFIRRVFVKQQQ
ncbi:hypothetical protein ACQ4PT_044807 [Festuca glaucescens]